MITIRSITREDQPRLRKFWVERWGGEIIVAHGVVYHVDTMDGFLALDGKDIVGLITLAHSHDESHRRW